MKPFPIVLSVGGAGALSFGLALAHPFGNPRAAKGGGEILQGADAPANVKQLLAKKCGDCHSESGEWPIYGRFAPASWMLERDVAEAREHMNLSRWAHYLKEDQAGLLTRMGAEARSGEMPPARYTLVHRGAKLSAEDRETIYQWTKAERKRIRTEVASIEGAR